MTSRPCAVDEDLTLPDASDRMRANNIRHLIVLRDQRLVGVVSQTDLAFEFGFARGNGIHGTLADAMRSAFTCPPDAPIAWVAREMEARHLETAVIVDEDDMFVLGIFTLTDALRALRQMVEGGQVLPAVLPTHAQPVSPERRPVPYSVRAKGILRSHHAAPAAHDGTFNRAFT